MNRLVLMMWDGHLSINEKSRDWLGKNKLPHHTFIQHIWDPFGHTEIGPGKTPNDLNTSCWNRLNTSWVSRMQALGSCCRALPSCLRFLPYFIPGPPVFSFDFYLYLIRLYLPTQLGDCIMRLWWKRKIKERLIITGKSSARCQNKCYLLQLYLSGIEAVLEVKQT